MKERVEGRSLVTRGTIIEGLSAAGVSRGDHVLVHTSLSGLGYVIGGSRTVIEAIIDAVGPSGTVMMPTFSGELSDPAEWKRPPVPDDWIERIRAETPAYDPRLTPTRQMGGVAEHFRHFPGVLRSAHPQSSFAAVGKRNKELVGDHELDFRFGWSSPLGALYRLQGKVILLGVSRRKCTQLYLVEHFLQSSDVIKRVAPIVRQGKKEWVTYTDFVYSGRWFERFFDDLEVQLICRNFELGDAHCILVESRTLVDLAVKWRKCHPITDVVSVA